MKTLFQVIFALLFLLSAFHTKIFTVRPSTISALTVAKAHGRSSVVRPMIRPTVMNDGEGIDKNFPVDLSNRAAKKRFPCESVRITTVGAACDGYILDFPEVIMKDVLEGGKFLPSQSELVFFPEKVIDGSVYRNFTLTLRWEPATPEFLQIYLEEYLPYWRNRIPYRLFWTAHYEMCSEGCSTLYDKGEFLPADIEDLSPSLAADINFNGVPAAFWNENIKP